MVHPRMSRFFEPNLRALAEKFPSVANQLEARSALVSGLQAEETSEGPIVVIDGRPLDHPKLPRQAAQQWAVRSCAPLRSRDAPIIVFGFGGGYHLEALPDEGCSDVSVYEPSIAVLRIALEMRDLRGLIQTLSSLSVGELPREIPHDAVLMTRSLSQAVFPSEWEELRRVVYAARGAESLKPTVAVLGPLQGGTLPILPYVHHALVKLGLRARPIDVSPMAAGYHQVSALIRDPFRQKMAESGYVDYISNLAVESIQDRPVDICICLAQAPITLKALQQLRSMGVVTVLWFVEDFRRFSYWRPFAPYFDFIFTIQKEPCISAMKEAGAAQVHYLPVGCDPAVHAPCVLSPEDRARWGSPVSFVGAGYHNRQQVFAALSHLPLKIWGTEWPHGKPFNRLVQEGGRRLTPAEYTKIFNSTTINLNLHSSSERDGVDPFGDFVNPRTFELAATGAFQLVDQRSLLSELFTPGKEVVTFKSVAELKDLIPYFLENPDQMSNFVNLARQRAVTEHTYEQRIRSMLGTIYGVKYDHLAERRRNHPWTQLLERGKTYPALSERLERAHKRGDDPSLDSLVAEIGVGKGKLNDLDQEILFLHHVKQNMILKKPGEA
jgi:spore maturation protein CgeB